MGDIADMYDYALEEDEPYSRPRDVTCNRCGKAGLIWSSDGVRGWLLTDKECNPHQCSTPAEDFV